MAPQITVIVLLCISLGINIATHGKERKPNNAWVAFCASIIWLTLLWWGGFWNVFL